MCIEQEGQVGQAKMESVSPFTIKEKAISCLKYKKWQTYVSDT